MPLATVLVIGGIAALFTVLAAVLMRLDARAGGDAPQSQPVRVRQARFPRSIR
jgi:hypothetical protein